MKKDNILKNVIIIQAWDMQSAVTRHDVYATQQAFIFVVDF